MASRPAIGTRRGGTRETRGTFEMIRRRWRGRGSRSHGRCRASSMKATSNADHSRRAGAVDGPSPPRGRGYRPAVQALERASSCSAAGPVPADGRRAVHARADQPGPGQPRRRGPAARRRWPRPTRSSRRRPANWDLNAFLQEIDSFGPEPPLAFNTRLIEAARDHDAAMLAANTQFHSPAGYLNNPQVAPAADGQAYYPTGDPAGPPARTSSPTPATSTRRIDAGDYVELLRGGLPPRLGQPRLRPPEEPARPRPRRGRRPATLPVQRDRHRPADGRHPDHPARRRQPDRGERGPERRPRPRHPGVRLAARATPSSPASSTTTRDDNQLLHPRRRARRGRRSRPSATRPGDLPDPDLGLGRLLARAAAGHLRRHGTGGNLPAPAVDGRHDRPGQRRLGRRSHAAAQPQRRPAGARATTTATARPTWPSTAPPPAQWFIDGPAAAGPFGVAGRRHPRARRLRRRRPDRDRRLPPDDRPVVHRRPRPQPVTFGAAGRRHPRPRRLRRRRPRPRSPSTARRPASGSSPATAAAASSFGQPGVDIPVPGDYDGDGQRRARRLPARPPASGSSPATPRPIVQFGRPGVDIPVPGDYDGDGQDRDRRLPPDDRPVVHRRPRRQADRPFGQPGVDIPVPGDYDGDGQTDLAVYRPTTGQWFDAVGRAAGRDASSSARAGGEPAPSRPG